MSTAASNLIPAKLVLFPDTNIFIEAKDLKDLPWEQLASHEIRLVACPIVLEEIDEHKTSPKNRVKERARKWNSEFKKLLKPSALPLVLKEGSPRVTLELLDVSSMGSTQSASDLTKPDNQLIDWTLRYRASNLSEDVRLLTDDTGPLGRAYAIGLPAIEMPPHWRPDLGPSEEQKEIESLRRKLALYEQKYPTPSILFFDERGQKIDHIKVTVRRYRSLLSGEVDALINALKEEDPLPTAEQLKSREATPLDRLFAGHVWRPPSDQIISKYLTEDYPAWLEQVRQVLFHLGTDLEIETSIASFRIAWQNIGARPAERAKVTIKVGGHFSFLKDDVEAASLFKAIQMPPRPTPPKGKLVHPMQEAVERASSWQNVAELAQFGPVSPGDFDFSNLSRKERKKNAWYLDEEKGQSDYTQEKIFTCEEWRHQEGPFQQAFSLRFGSNQSSGSDNIVTVIFHANNLPEPAKQILKVEATIEHHDVAEYARKLLRLN